MILLLPALALAAPAWPGADGGNGVLHLLEVPAGALPPGPATVRSRDTHSAAQHVVRFDVAATGPTPVRVWSAWSVSPTGMGETWFDVTSEAGGTWSYVVDPMQDWSAPSSYGVVVLGAPGDLATLAELSRSAARAGWAPLEGLALGDPGDADSCRALVTAQLVVSTRPAEAAALADCAARGATVLIVGPDAPVDGLPADQSARWGRGALAWTPALDPQAASLALALASADVQGAGSSLDYLPPPQRLEDPTIGPAAVLVLLLLYLVSICVVGVAVGIRPRRPLAAWGWFPAVAGVATAGAIGVGLVWRDAPEVTVMTVDQRAPNGVGLRRTTLHVDAAYGKTYALDVDWQDADLGQLAPSAGYGSPFGSSVPPTRIEEDRLSGHTALSGLAPGQYGQASLGWVEPVGPEQPAAAEVEVVSVGPDSAVLRVSGGRAVVRGVLAIDGQTGKIPPTAAGDQVVVELGATHETPEVWDPVESWLDGALYSAPQSLDSYHAVLELAPTAADAPRFAPAVAVRQLDVLVVAGPLRRSR